MSKNKFEESLKSGNHFRLSQLAGEWEGITKTWFEPGKLADESPAKGKIRSILGGRFVINEYQGSVQGKPLEGISIYGYDMNEEKFQCAFVDSFHNGTTIMLQNGEERSDKFSALGHYNYIVSPTEIQTWGWRTEIDIVDKDKFIISIYNITPGGKEALGIETVYKHIKE